MITRNDDPRPDYPLGPALDFLQRMWHLNHALESLSSRMEKELGVTAQQRLIIRCIGKYPGMNAGQLASMLHVDPGTVSATLSRLEDRGLLTRRRDPRDRRRTAIGLTAEGQALSLPSQGTVEAAVERLLVAAPAGDIESVARVLAQLTRLMDEERGGWTTEP